MKPSYFLYSFIIFFAFFSCKKEPQNFITFHDSNYNELVDETTLVDLNSNYDLIIKVGFESQVQSPVYSIRKNEDTEIQLDEESPEYYNREVHGWNGPEELYTEQVRISLEFNDSDFDSGDYVQINCRHSGIEKTQTFIIQ